MKNECFNDTTGELKLKDSLTIISEAWVKFRKYDCQPLQPCKKMGCDYRDKCSWQRDWWGNCGRKLHLDELFTVCEDFWDSSSIFKELSAKGGSEEINKNNACTPVEHTITYAGPFFI